MFSSGRCDDIPYANEIVHRIREGEYPSTQRQSFVLDLAHRADRFEPAKDLLHKFALSLTDLIARMSRGTLIQRTTSLALRILGCMRRNVQTSHLVDKVSRVIVFVNTKGQAALTFPFHLLHHRPACGSFCCAIGFGVRRTNDEPMTIVHHHMTQKGQLRLFPRALLIESGFGICCGLMCIIRSLFSMEINRGMPGSPPF